MNAPFSSAKDFPDVSPRLKDRFSNMMAHVPLIASLGNFFEKAGPGNKVKVIIKVPRITKGKGIILKKVSFNVVK